MHDGVVECMCLRMFNTRLQLRENGKALGILFSLKLCDFFFSLHLPDPLMHMFIFSQ